MARRLRLHVPGGFHHVTLRGNHQHPIFFTNSDRDLLNEIVAETVEQCGLRVHAYCWMTNHLHFLVQISDIPLGRAVLRIASRYARTVQKRLETTGHLFERRYHSTIVDADRYLLALLRYIHLNPVEAGITRDPLEYWWSSHRNYLGLGGQSWVTTDFGLRMLGATRPSAIAAYRALLGATEESQASSDFLRPNVNFKDVLGDDDFARRVGSSCPALRSRMTLDDLVGECCRLFDVTEAKLMERSRSRVAAVARAWLASAAVTRQIASVSEVARRLGRSEGALRQTRMRYPHPSGSHE